MPPIALIAPDVCRAEAAARRLARSHGSLAPYSLEGFLRSRRKVRGVVIDAGAGSAKQAAEFIRRASRRLLLPPPASRLSAAIAGLRDAPEENRGRHARGTATSGLLLEGSVTRARARRALAREELSRDWIVEDPRRIRLSEGELREVAREGVRWFALMPIALLAIAGDAKLRRHLQRATGVFPRGTPFWDLPAGEGPL